jgi:hypothetical protein
MKESKIIEYVKKDINKLNDIISSIDTNNYKQYKSTIKVFNYVTSIESDEDDISWYYKFKISSKGLVSNSCYNGFIYSDKDIPHNYNFGDNTYKLNIINKELRVIIIKQR